MIRMWKDSQYVRSQDNDNIRHDYLFDPDICTFCQTKNPNAGSIPWCAPEEDMCSSYREKLITFLKTDQTDIWLYSPVPGYNDYGEIEEILIGIDERGRFRGAVAYLSFKDCGYDPSTRLNMTVEQAKEIITNIPFFQDGEPPSGEEYGLRLQFFVGDKQDWLRDYQEAFEKLKEKLRLKGKVEKLSV